MISKALRPAGQRSKHLKRVSHHLLGDDPNSATDDQKRVRIEAIDNEVSGEVLAKTGKDKQAHKRAKNETNGKRKKPSKGKKDKAAAAKPGKKEKAKTAEPAKSGKKDKTVAAKPAKSNKKVKAKAAKPAKPGKKEIIANGKNTAAGSPTPIAAAQTNPANARSTHLRLVPVFTETVEPDTARLPQTLPAVAKPVERQTEQATTTQAEPVPAPGNPDMATSTSRRQVPVHLILVAGLITLFGLWGYRYWNTAQDATKTTSTHATIVQQDQPKHERVATVFREEKAAQSVTNPPPTSDIAPSEVVATREIKPESMATKPQARGGTAVAHTPQRFRPPTYGPYPPYPAWQRPPHYGNTLPPRFRPPVPTRFYPGQRTVGADSKR